MSATRFDEGSDGSEPSWGNETLPLTVRKELLARELRKLGFGGAGAGAGTPGGGSPQQQQQQQPKAQGGGHDHPQGEADASPHGR